MFSLCSITCLPLAPGEPHCLGSLSFCSLCSLHNVPTGSVVWTLRSYTQGISSTEVVAEDKNGSLSFERFQRCSFSTEGIRQGPRVTTGRRESWTDTGRRSRRTFFSLVICWYSNSNIIIILVIKTCGVLLYCWCQVPHVNSFDTISWSTTVISPIFFLFTPYLG